MPDNSDMMFPKKSYDERSAKTALMLFRRWCKGLSHFGKCDNPKCKNPGVCSHHIIFKSQDIDHSVGNSMYLCAVCHHFAHCGVVGSAAERHEIEVCTARMFVIVILRKRISGSVVDRERWSVVLLILETKENITEVQGD